MRRCISVVLLLLPAKRACVRVLMAVDVCSSVAASARAPPGVTPNALDGGKRDVTDAGVEIDTASLWLLLV